MTEPETWAEQWVSPIGDLVHVPALLIDPDRNRVTVDLDLFHILMVQAGFVRVDNLRPDQIMDTY